MTLPTDAASTAFEDTLRILLFQAVREVLVKKTLRATIYLEQIHGHVRLRIRDDGKGFDADRTTGEPKAMPGLLNIRHQLSLMGCD